MKRMSVLFRTFSVVLIIAVFSNSAVFAARSATPEVADQPVVDGRFPVEGEPWTVAAGSDAVWVATLDGDVVQLDPASGEVVTTFDPPGHATDLAVDGAILWILTPDGGGIRRVVMPTQPDGSPQGESSWAVAGLHRLDAASGSVEETIPVEAHGGGLAVSDDAVWVGSAAWTEDEPGMLLRIDPGTNAIVATIPIEGASSHVSAVAASEDGIWAMAPGYRALDPAVIALVDPETNAVVQSVTLEPHAWGGSTLAAVPGAVWLTGVDMRGADPVATLVRVEAATGAVSVREIEGFGHQVAFGNGHLWLSDCLAATVTMLDSVTGDLTGEPVVVGEPVPADVDPLTQPIDGASCPQHPAVSENAVWVPVPGDGVVVRLRP